jgi:SAM-dependent methyltransferase
VDDFFDFKAHNTLADDFAIAYLKQYYIPERGITDDECAVLLFILANAEALRSCPSCIEVGCGPTIHHALMLSPYVSSIVMADYLENNIAQVEKWWKGDQTSWNWNFYTKEVLRLEGQDASSTAVLQRESHTRNRITACAGVNLLDPQPLGTTQTFDLVSSFYCTEEIAHTPKGWQTILANLVSLLRPSGYLLMSCLAETSFYHIKGEDGLPIELPCLFVTEELLRETLTGLGFDELNTIISLAQTPSQKDEGVPGVFLVLARR